MTVLRRACKMLAPFELEVGRLLFLLLVQHCNGLSMTQELKLTLQYVYMLRYQIWRAIWQVCAKNRELNCCWKHATYKAVGLNAANTSNNVKLLG